MKKPKKLFRYQKGELVKHPVDNSCQPRIFRVVGDSYLWRCKCGEEKEFYGYSRLREAKEEEESRRPKIPPRVYGHEKILKDGLKGIYL